MELSVTLAPDGGLRVVLPTRRTLDLGTEASALRFLLRILRDQANGKRDQRGCIGEFPTQHVIEIWRKEDLRQQAEAQKERFVGMGIDLGTLEFEL